MFKDELIFCTTDLIEEYQEKCFAPSNDVDLAYAACKKRKCSFVH